MKNNVLLQTIARQLGFDLEKIICPQNFIALFTQLSNLKELYRQITNNGNPPPSTVDRIRASHEELIRFCETNQITLSKRWRNVENLLKQQFTQTVDSEELFTKVANQYDQYRFMNLSTQLDTIIMVMKASFQLFFWSQYLTVDLAIRRLAQLAQNCKEIQDLTLLFRQNAARLSTRSEKISGLLEQFYVRVDPNEKRRLLEEVRTEILDAQNNEFLQTKQEYDKVEKELQKQLEWSIRKQKLTNIGEWGMYLLGGVLTISSVVVGVKSWKNNGNLGTLAPALFVGGCASGFIGYKIFRYETKSEKECEEMLLEQIEQLKVVKANFDIILQEFRRVEDRANNFE